MDRLDKWVGESVRLKETISAQVMIGKELVKTDPDEWGRRSVRKVSLMLGEVFTVIGHYSGKFDLLYQPLRMTEKVILHVPPSALEIHIL